jgi:hypothetical protein
MTTARWGREPRLETQMKLFERGQLRRAWGAPIAA